MRVAFCLPGLHRVARGAEVALESIGAEMARQGGIDVTLIGSGHSRANQPYRFVHAGCLPRERFRNWPSLPVVRNETMYEELSFVPEFLRQYRPDDYDVTVVCSYPFLNWAVRARRFGRKRPLNVFVTENGDWPLHRKQSEYRLFDCDALICTNPDYFDTHGSKWKSALIPNGVDCDRFGPGPGDRAVFELPIDRKVVLIASALIPSKRVIEGVRATAKLPNVHLLVAGDGPLRDELVRVGTELMSERFHHICAKPDQMPILYRSVDLMLHMSLQEPSALVYAEALATGLPIVTHDRRVSRWTLGEHATLVDTNDLDSVARAIELTLSNPGHADARVTVARERYQWSEIARQYSEFFREVLAMRSAQ